MAKAKQTAAKKAARDLSTFRADHDPTVKNPLRVKAALARMLAEYGEQAYMYETRNPTNDETDMPVFQRYSDVGIAQLSTYRKEFLPHVVRVKNARGAAMFVWFASPEAATKARGRAAQPSDLL